MQSLDGKLIVTIPSGESSGQISVTVSIATNEVPSAAVKTLVGDAYKITLNEGTLSTASISLKYEPNRVIAPAGTPVGSIVSLAKLAGDIWQPVEGATVDTANNQITATVSSFSIFGVIQKGLQGGSSAGGGSTGGTGAGGGQPTDTTPPDTLIGSSPLSLTSSKSASFILVSTESGSTFECKLDAPDFAPCNSPIGYQTLAEGTHQFQVRAKDKAGNVDSSPLVFEWKIDTVAPSAPDAAKLVATDLVAPLVDSLAGLAGAVTADAVTVVVYKEAGLSTSIGSQPVKADGSFDAVGIGSDQRDGSALVYVVAVDAAGNTGSATSIRTDKIGVESKITSSPSTTIINQNATFQFGPATTEIPSSYECAVDSGAFAACTSPFTSGSLPLGTHTFYVRGLDQFANTGAIVSKTWTLGPQDVTLTTKPPTTTVNLKGQIVFTANPTGTGVTYQCRIDSGTFASCTSPYNFGGLSIAAHTFEIRPYDQFGNQGTTSSYSWTIIIGPDAIDSFGQFDGTNVLYNKGSNGGLSTPEHVAIDLANKRLFLSDTANHRVLVYDLNSNMTLVDRYPEFVLGQPNHESNSATTPGVGIPEQSQWGMNSPRGLAIYNSRLFVADSANNRILVFDARSAGSANLVLCGNTTTGLAEGMKASCVIGQAGFLTSAAALTQAGLSNPQGLSIHKDSAELYVADKGNHRALVHSLSALASGQNAAFVIGQADFTSGAADRGGAVGQNTLDSPSAVAYFHHSTSNTYRYLAIADTGNNRVLVHSKVTAPTVDNWDNGENAVYVLGQKLFTTSTIDIEDNTVAGGLCGDGNVPLTTNACGMDTPKGVAWNEDSSRLYVADMENHRVLVFDTGLITNGQPAANVLGQTAVTNYVSSGSTGSNTLSLTYTPSTLTGPLTLAATMVPVVTTAGYTVPARIQIESEAIQCDTKTAIQLNTCSRGIKGTTAADHLTVGTAVQRFTPSPVGLVFSENAYGRLYVADGGSHRVQMFNVFPGVLVNGKDAGDTLGHLTTTGAGNMNVSSPNNPSSTSFFSPVDAAFDANALRLYVTDSKLNRVLSFGVNSSMTLLDRQADNVIGQSSLTASDAAVTQDSGLSSPEGVVFDGTANKLYVADRANNRVLVYDTSTFSDGMNASFVLGQPDYVSSAANCTSSGMSAPSGLAIDAPGKRLYVADAGNNRVMVYNTTTLGNGMFMDKYLGEGGGCSQGTTQSTMKNPKGVDLHPTSYKLFVADTGNNRMLVYNVGAAAASVTDGMNAANVIGQSNFTSAGAGTSATTLNSPQGVEVDSSNNRLFVSDTNNHRVVIVDLDLLSDGMSFINVIGQPDLTTGAISATAINRLRAPRASTYDSVSNRLYVIDNQNNRIAVFETR
ncbi:MAG: hypothetical protein HYT87_19020 [Nitrospirae bacterium]|nr:hypothetical protein [Nitrospirota bacterium]